MSDFDPGIFKQPDESDEQHAHRFKETILAENWSSRFQANGAEYRALGDALNEEQDPAKVIELTEQRGQSLIRNLGSGAISLWQRDVLSERQDLEEKFGQGDQPE